MNFPGTGIILLGILTVVSPVLMGYEIIGNNWFNADIELLQGGYHFTGYQAILLEYISAISCVFLPLFIFLMALTEGNLRKVIAVPLGTISIASIGIFIFSAFSSFFKLLIEMIF